MNYLHVSGVIVRYVFLMRRAWHRAFDMFYWTTMQILVWGFVTLWLKETIVPGEVNIVLLLLGGLLFWEVFWRAQQGMMIPFLEDMWARNLVNIFSSPLSAAEFLFGHIFLSFAKASLSLLLGAILAWALYALHIWELGFYLIPFALNIFIFGWIVGIVTIAFVIRFGPSFEMLAWSVPFLFWPLSAVFYPVTILPAFFQKVAFFLPTMHLFEGMRGVVLEQAFLAEHIFWATSLNLAYFVLAVLFFSWMLRLARKRGYLSRLVTE